jgi:hypothetical protein
MLRLLASAAAVAILSGIALAADLPTPTEADVVQVAALRLSFAAEGWGGFSFFDDPDDELDDDEMPIAGGFAAVSIPFWQSYSVQFDGATEWYFPEDKTIDNPLGLAAFGGHLNWRDPNRGLIGIFGGGGVNDNDFDPGGLFDDGDLFFVGAEGQVYFNNITLYGQAGFADGTIDDAPDEGFVDGFFVRGVGRYFLANNTKFEGEVSYGRTNEFIDGNDDGDILNWGARAETRLFGSPVHGFVGYRGGFYQTSDQGGQEVTENAVYGGLRVVLGTTSLRDTDRYGATLDLPLLPLRANNMAEALD